MMAKNDDAPPSRLTSKQTWLISQASIRAHRLLTGALAGVNYRGFHYRLLAALEEFGPASQAALGRRTEMDRSDVVAALNELDDRGLVKRAPDPRDSRRNVVTITSIGRAELKRLDDILAAVQDELLEPLSPSERRHLAELLARVVAHHTAD
jgi:MarR family transcriptional regulator, lower aerobic nicotinate degradation pathway regulator